MSTAHRITARRSWKRDISIKIQLQQTSKRQPAHPASPKWASLLGAATGWVRIHLFLPRVSDQPSTEIHTSSARASPTYQNVLAVGLAFRMPLNPSEGLVKVCGGRAVCWEWPNWGGRHMGPDPSPASLRCHLPSARRWHWAACSALNAAAELVPKKRPQS